MCFILRAVFSGRVGVRLVAIQAEFVASSYSIVGAMVMGFVYADWQGETEYLPDFRMYRVGVFVDVSVFVYHVFPV